MLRVCHLIDHTDSGGAQQVVLDLVEARSADIDPTVIALRAARYPFIDERLQAARARTISLGLRRTSAFGPARIRSEVARGRFDVVHAHLDHSTSSGIGAILTLGRRRPRILSHLHNDPRGHHSWLFRVATRLMAPYVDRHVAPSASMVAALRAEIGHRMARLSAIENGIDLEWFCRERHDPGGGAALRGGAKRVVGFIGRLARQKRVDLLLQTVPALLAAEPSTRILLIGEGPIRGQLERQCQRAGISHAVHFAGHLDDVMPALLAMDVFVLPSDFEGFGLVLAEAMAMEVPVVATRVTGVVDVVRDGETGLLVDPGDAEGLASRILTVFEDATLRTSLLEAARARARKEFSRSRMAERFEAVYRDLAGAPDGSSATTPSAALS